MRWILPLLIFAGVAYGRESTNADAVSKVSSGGHELLIAPRPEWVTHEPLPSKWPENQPGAIDVPRRVWLLSSQIDRRSGRYQRHFDYAFEVLSNASLADAAQFDFSFDPGYQTATLHAVEVIRDGKSFDRLDRKHITLARRESDFERQMFDGMVSALLVLEDIRVGDIVRVDYTIVGANPILEDNDADHFYLGWTDPILDRRVRVLADATPGLTWKIDRGLAEPRILKHRSQVELDYREPGRAPIRDEGNYPNWFSPMPSLTVAERRDWRKIAQWAMTLYPDEDTPKVRDRAAELREISGEEAQILAALRAVQDEVRYFGTEIGNSTHRPAHPDEVLTRRYGDCKDKARLLAALLVELGYDAVPALVNASSGRAIADEPPSASAFDHVIVMLARNGNRYWLDPTLTEQRGSLDQLGFPDYGMALPIAASTDALVEMKPPAAYVNSIAIEESFEGTAGGKTAFVVRSTYRGAFADEQRRALASRGFENASKDWVDFYSKQFVGVDVTTPARQTDDATKNELAIEERYTLGEFWRSAAERASYVDLDAPTFAQRVPLMLAADRKSPLWLPFPASISYTQKLVPPPKSELSNSSELISVENDGLIYSRALKVAENTLLIKHALSTRADHVAATHLDKYNADARAIRDAVSVRARVEFEDATATPRDQRLKDILRDLIDEQAKK